MHALVRVTFDMDAVTVLYASAAVLLVIAGAAKVIRPATTAALMEMLHIITKDLLLPAYQRDHHFNTKKCSLQLSCK